MPDTHEIYNDILASSRQFLSAVGMYVSTEPLSPPCPRCKKCSLTAYQRREDCKFRRRDGEGEKGKSEGTWESDRAGIMEF